jgi:hypothetical protein
MTAQAKAIEPAFETTFLFFWSQDDLSEFVKASNFVASRLGLPIVME